AMGKIFFLLKQSSGVDFSRYKHTTLKRLISRRMVLQRIERVDDYVTMLRSNPEELRSLFHDLLINVTGFFRDHSVYATLKKKVVPKIIKSKSGQGEIRETPVRAFWPWPGRAARRDGGRCEPTPRPTHPVASPRPRNRRRWRCAACRSILPRPRLRRR